METHARKASDDVFSVIRNFGPEMSLKRRGNRILLPSVTYRNIAFKKKKIELIASFFINNYY